MVTRRRRWFRIVLWMVLGGLWRLNERYIWMAMRGYSVDAADPALERRLWDVFPAETLRFWPSFVSRSQDIAVFLEKTIPVRVYTRMTGFGAFVTHMSLLSPWIVAEWRGQTWCVSKEGRMWNMADESVWIQDLKIPPKPLWRFASVSGIASQDERPLPSGVFPAFFSVTAIEDFLASFGGNAWFGNVEEIVLDRREGADLFTLHFVREGQKFMILIQKEKYEWRELNFALEEILNTLRQEGGNHLIDATYRDKIVVEALNAGAEKGGSK